MWGRLERAGARHPSSAAAARPLLLLVAAVLGHLGEAIDATHRSAGAVMRSEAAATPPPGDADAVAPGVGAATFDKIKAATERVMAAATAANDPANAAAGAPMPAGSNKGYGTWMNYSGAADDGKDVLDEGRHCVSGAQMRCSNRGAAMYSFLHSPGHAPARTCLECVDRCRVSNPDIGVWYASFKGPCSLEDESGRIAHEGSCGDGCECMCYIGDHCGARQADEEWNIIKWCDGKICSSCVSS